MHSCEVARPPCGTELLLQLSSQIIGSRGSGPAAVPLSLYNQYSDSPILEKLRLPRTSYTAAKKPYPDTLVCLTDLLWEDHIPICIEVYLAPDCGRCSAPLLLLERWTFSINSTKSQDHITSEWLLNAVRSQLHFSQVSAWNAKLKSDSQADITPMERQRKLSRENCNFKKYESNCDEEELLTTDNSKTPKLNVVYSMKVTSRDTEVAPSGILNHVFPITNIGNGVQLRVCMHSRPRIEEIPVLKCACFPSTLKRRRSKEELRAQTFTETDDPGSSPESQTSSCVDNQQRNQKRKSSAESLYKYINSGEGILPPPDTSVIANYVLVDDRMQTPCRQKGKHRCIFDEEEKPDEKKVISDEKRAKEIAKYMRRLRKEAKYKQTLLPESPGSSRDNSECNKTCDATCKCCGRAHKTYTSIPILQASRFDYANRFSSFRTSVSGLRTTSHNLYTVKTPSESRCCDRTSSSDENYRPSAKKLISSCTQTDDLFCECGKAITTSYSTPQLRNDDDDDDEEEVIFIKCDNSVVSAPRCDINDIADCRDKKVSERECDSCAGIIRKPKLKRLAPMVDKINKIVTERRIVADRENIPLVTPKRKNRDSVVDDNHTVLYEKDDDYESREALEEEEKKSQDSSSVIPSASDMDRFRYRLDSAASMVFHSRTGLPLTSSPAPLRRGKSSFDFDSSINSVSGIKSALYGACNDDPDTEAGSTCSPGSSPGSPNKLALEASVFNFSSPKVKSQSAAARNVFQHPTSSGLLGSFEESVLNGRLEPAATVAGFTAEIGASGSFCPPHLKLPVTVFFYSLGDNTTSAPYLGHINLGRRGYCVPRSGTIQATLFNPHGTVVKMFVVMYDLSDMPPYSRTFLRQRTLCVPSGSQATSGPKCLRYLIHLRFLSSKSGKVYLHTDIRMIVSRKADLDTAHSLNSALALQNYDRKDDKAKRKNQVETGTFQKRTISRKSESEEWDINANKLDIIHASPFRERRDSMSYVSAPVFWRKQDTEVSYELRSFTYGPENPKYSPR